MKGSKRPKEEQTLQELKEILLFTATNRLVREGNNIADLDVQTGVAILFNCCTGLY